MAYWIDVFTAETWTEARATGFAVSGFRTGRRPFARKVRPGDVFICYLGGGIGRWVGALKVASDLYEADSPRVWTSDVFPLRFKTEPITTLAPEQAIPVDELKGSLEMFRRLAKPRSWGFLFQASPSLIKDQSDGELLLEALAEAARSPVERPIPRKPCRRLPATG